MKYILLFIYRILNVIVSIVSVIIILSTFITRPLFGYLFMGSDYFDIEPEDQIEAVWDAIHYPLNKLYESIDDMDNVEFNFNKFWK